MKYYYSIYEDNTGRLHLAVMDENGSCIYYLCDADRALVVGALDALKAGGDPIADGWEGGEPDPATCYEEISNIVDARNGGAIMLDL